MDRAQTRAKLGFLSESGPVFGLGSCVVPVVASCVVASSLSRRRVSTGRSARAEQLYSEAACSGPPLDGVSREGLLGFREACPVNNDPAFPEADTLRCGPPCGQLGILGGEARESGQNPFLRPLWRARKWRRDGMGVERGRTHARYSRILRGKKNA